MLISLKRNKNLSLTKKKINYILGLDNSMFTLIFPFLWKQFKLHYFMNRVKKNLLVLRVIKKKKKTIEIVCL